jgi:WD40 repeat protein
MSNNNQHYRGGGGRSSYRGRNPNNYNTANGRGGGNRGAGRSGRGPPPSGVQARILPCKSWLSTGQCPHGHECKFGHVCQLHASIDAGGYAVADANAASNTNANRQGYNQQQQQQRAAVSSVALWDTNGLIQIFTGSHDGFWRLWNASSGFQKEFECSVGQRVHCLHVYNNVLYCGMEALQLSTTNATVGMLHAWNLQQPNVPPLEAQVDASFLRYAHNQAVTALAVHDAATFVTGSRDGSIRVWTLRNGAFRVTASMPGHAREVTGLVVVAKEAPQATSAVVPPPNSAAQLLLWSSSVDGSIRIWDMESGACQYSIMSGQPQLQQQQLPSAVPPQATPAPAVTALESFHSPSGTFVLSASLDGSIQVWKGTTGECVASETHGEGVVCMAIVRDATNTELVMVGLESGNIVCRNLVQTAKARAFEAIFVLTASRNVGHTDAVKCIVPGPQATFYSGGNDGKLMVWQINGDLGLQ